MALLRRSFPALWKAAGPLEALSVCHWSSVSSKCSSSMPYVGYPSEWRCLLQDADLLSGQRARMSTNSSPQVGRLNHVAIAVPNLSQAAERYRSVLGAQVSEVQHVPEHGVSVVFVTLPNTKLELLHPLGDDSPIAKFLQKNPSGGLHHICLEVPDIQESLDHVSKQIRVLDPVPKIGAHGNPVVFLHPKDNDGVLTGAESLLQ